MIEKRSGFVLARQPKFRRKTIYIPVLLGAALGLLTACRKEENYVTWLVPDIVNIPEDTVAGVNTLLADSGYDFQLKLEVVENDQYDVLVRQTPADIVFAGLSSSSANLPYALLEEGYFECLDDRLADSTFASDMPDLLWESVKFNGHIYVIPNETAQDMGVKVLFNAEKFTQAEAEAFTGDITQLPELLGEDGILLYQINGLEFASYYGYDYQMGVWIGQDGTVLNPLESEECIAWLTTINTLYLQERVSDETSDTGMDWSICITKDTERLELEEGDTYIYGTKAVLASRYSASTGIAAASDKKEEAFTLLSLLHTDETFANCLIYGTDVQEQDGYAVDGNGEVLDGYINKLIFGLDMNLLRGSEFLMKFETAADKVSYYEENVLASPAMDVHVEMEPYGLRAVMNEYSDIWQSKTFEEDLAAMRSSLEAEEIDVMIEQLQAQLNE